MLQIFCRNTFAAIAISLGLQLLPTLATGADHSGSVVKIYVKSQRGSYDMPWKSSQPLGGTGTGFIVEKRRILTNAHVVSDARVIEVQKAGDPRKWPARVKFIGHDCDLAMIEVEDQAFYTGTKTLKLSKKLPRLDDEVVVIGFPLGGDRLSVTRGIVSRIDYSNYSHSGIDEHLALQVDAAINPGNSGGPVLLNGSVIGVAFQGLRMADNIGYAIPTPIIRHFLMDVEDGTYNGYPELGVYFLNLQNRSMRKDMKVPKTLTGVVAYHIDPFGAAFGKVEERDILTRIDGYPIANDGSVTLDGNQMLFAELLERKLSDDSIELDIVRSGKSITLTIPLDNPHDPFIFRNVYDQHPQYFMIAGLVFSPLSREHLRLLGQSIGQRDKHQLLYYTRYAKMDGFYKDRTEFVVLIKRLPHPANTYHGKFQYQVLSTVNAQPIRELKDVKAALDKPIKGFHVFEFEGQEDTLVLDAKSADAITKAIMTSYGVPEQEYIK